MGCRCTRRGWSCRWACGSPGASARARAGDAYRARARGCGALVRAHGRARGVPRCNHNERHRAGRDKEAWRDRLPSSSPSATDEQGEREVRTGAGRTQLPMARIRARDSGHVNSRPVPSDAGRRPVPPRPSPERIHDSGATPGASDLDCPPRPSAWVVVRRPARQAAPIRSGPMTSEATMRPGRQRAARLPPR